MTRVFNFSAGPSMLDESVLRKAAQQLLEYGCSGQSVMEMSHRSSDFTAIIDECEQRLRLLMNIPDNYHVLFLQGGASLQFTMIPMNLKVNGTCDLIHTGAWTKKAIKEANRFMTCRVIASSEEAGFSFIPKVDQNMLDPQADYVYICENNTIYGTKYKQLPPVPEHVPLIADLSSCILSEPVDVSKYGLIFAGAQKNMGIAGLTVVIIRDDLVQRCPDDIPDMLSYKKQIANKSMLNTPPTYAIYMCNLVLEWLENEMGGLNQMKVLNEKKAKALYDYLDSTDFYQTMVVPEDRSMMNVVFVTGNPELDKLFVQQAKDEGMINLKGHRSIGGMRASIYNAMPYEGVLKLIDFMKKFEEAHHEN